MADIPFNPREIMNAIGGEVQIESLDVMKFFLIDVARRTPVRSGLAAGNWRTSQGAPAVGVVNRRQAGSSIAAGLRTITSVSKKLKRTVANGGRGIAPSVWITNSVPYIFRLNSGSSAQAPRFFVELAWAAAAEGQRTPLRKFI